MITQTSTTALKDAVTVGLYAIGIGAGAAMGLVGLLLAA